MGIRAVVFDVGGVLERVDDATWPQTWLGRWAEQADLPFHEVVERLARHAPDADVVTGRVSEAEVRRAYQTVLGLDDEQADRMMAEMWDAYCGAPDREMQDFASALRGRYLTAILSNSADGARREEQRRYGFEQLVDVVVYSHEVGLAKPDPAVFRLTEERLGVAPSEIVLLDDHPGHVEAACDLGWHAVRHQDAAESIREIRRLLAP